MFAIEPHSIEMARLVELMVRWRWLLDPSGEPASERATDASLDRLLSACIGDDDEPWASVAQQARLDPADRASMGPRELLRQALPHRDTFTSIARRYL